MASKTKRAANAAAARTANTKKTKAKEPILIEGRSKEDFREGLALAKRTGRPVRFVNGLAVRRTDPEKVAALLARAKEKQTEPISLRLPIADLEEAKRLASKHGVGYQTLLKQIIHEALGRAS